MDFGAVFIDETVRFNCLSVSVDDNSRTYRDAGLDVVLMNYLGYGRLNGVRFCFDEFNFGMIMR